MARVRIYRKDGSPTPFFWREEDGKERTHLTVYKRTDAGTKRLRGVHFNAKTNEMVKE